MPPPSSGSVLTMLHEADAALWRGRHAEGLRLVERALAREPVADDLRLRLHLARGHALWLGGRTRAGVAEVDKTAPECRLAPTRGRALDMLGLFAWKAQRLERAQALLTEAQTLYASAGCGAGVARTLWRQAGLLRDGGRLECALEKHTEAVEAARVCGKREVLGEALTSRGSTLAALGRWEAAREDLASSAALFLADQDPREHTRAGLVRAVVELAGGELAAARESLARARAAACPEGSDPRTLGEIALLRCDLMLAVGSAQGALAEAGEAVTLFAGVASGEGETRSRMRMVHCLLTLGCPAEALSHARRALESASEARPDLRAIALIALGRAQGRAHVQEAERAFAAAVPCSTERPAFEAASRLGLALARGCGRAHPEVAGALAALEAWGDRRFLFHCLRAVDEMLGREPAAPSICAVAVAQEDEATRVLGEAAVALVSPEPWPARWAAAMRAVASVLRWWRAVLAAEPGWELRRDLDEAQPLGADDLALCLVSCAAGPFTANLAADPALRRHPQRVLHGLGTALVAPVRPGLSLQVDLREGCAVGERELALLVQLARLIERSAPGEEACADDAREAPAAFGEIIGRCPPMRLLMREAARIAPTAATVHIYGETGTGKEGLARALHLASPRGDGPWVAVNASSISDDLFESELFGHVKGAFTGAVSDRRGYVAEAERGTLFLDEVTDFSARAQAKLLRFLQEREYRRVGDPRLHRADVRIVTASNTALEERVASGHFRNDLMYRLNQHVLVLPPLRERGEDVPLLARHCLRRAAETARTPVPTLSREAAALLQRYAWPGNVRELESEMGRALVRCGGAAVRTEDLSLALVRPAPARMPLRRAVDAFERGHIQQALQRNGGNRSHTAVELGLSRQALLAKITRLGIAPAPPP